MKELWKQLIVRLILLDKTIPAAQQEFTPYEIAKASRELRISINSFIKDIFLMTLGVASAAFGLKGFLLPSQFIDGGVTGISLLISLKSSLPLWILLIVINIPFMLLAAKTVNKQFALKAAVSILGLALCLEAVDFPRITDDKLLVAVFGGFFLGAGIGLSIRGGSVLDGTEVMAIFLSRKMHTTIGDFIIIFNIVIFSVAAYLLSAEQALYSIVTYLAASKTLDFVVEGIEEYTGVTIISSHSEEIRLMIINVLGRGVTIYQGKGGYGKSGSTRHMDILYTVITRLEVSKLNTEIEKIDPHAFVVTNSVKDTKGGMIKRRPLKH
jgi:uncharacterized membrane-anchored protein YitT (DUF2179 family)